MFMIFCDLKIPTSHLIHERRLRHWPYLSIWNFSEKLPSLGNNGCCGQQFLSTPQTIQHSFSTEMRISLSGVFVHCFGLFSLMHLIYVFGFFNVFVYPFFPLKATVTGFQKLVFSETKHWTRKRTIKPSLSYFFIHLSISIKFILKVPLLVLPQLFL